MYAHIMGLQAQYNFRVAQSHLRILTRTKKFDHISPILKDLHWLKVENRIIFKILVLAYKCLNNLAPTYLSELIHKAHTRDNMRSQNQYNLVIPKARPVYGERAFQFAAPFRWNQLPINIKNAKSLESFKTELKTHLLSRQ